MRKNRKAALVIASVASLFAATRASATAYIWDGSDSANNTNWNNPLNWTLDAGSPSAAGDSASFGAAGLAPAGTVTNTITQDTTIASVNWNQNDLTNFQTTAINAGVTLTLTNGLLLQTAVVPTGTSPFTGAQAAIKSATPGSGALVVTGGLVISTGKDGGASTAESTSLLDLSGLSSFSYTNTTNGVLGVGAGPLGVAADGRYSGNIILADTNAVNAINIEVGIQSGVTNNGAPTQSVLKLGTTNTFNTTFNGGRIQVGADNTGFGKYNSGLITFYKNLTNPSLTIGTSTNLSSLNIGYGFTNGATNASNSAFPFGVFDTTSASGGTDGTLNAFFSTVKIGTGVRGQQSGNSGGGTGMLWFDKGTVTASSVLSGYNEVNAVQGTANNIVGVINVGVKGGASDAGQGALVVGSGANAFIMAQRASNSVSAINSYLNIANNGSVTADVITLGDNQKPDNVGGGVNAVINLKGGVLTVNGIKLGASTGSLNTRIINFNGGTLRAGMSSANFLPTLTGAAGSGAYVYSGGANIDTNGNDITIDQALLSPAGTNGVSIALNSGGTKYTSAPVILISGGGGTGASAIATLNGSQQVNSITMLSPGTGYTSNPTVTLISGSSLGPPNSAPVGGTAATFTITRPANTGGGLTKIGSGNLTLTGANTYVGTTNVTAGTLTLNGSHTGGGAYTIGDGTNFAAFSGTGSTTSAVTVKNASVISPGTSVGTISTGAFTLESGATLLADLDFGSTTGDQVLLPSGGDVSLAGDLQLQFLGLTGSNSVPKTFVLVHIANTKTGNFTGSFANVNPVTNAALAYTVNYHYAADADAAANDVAITFTSVPEPSAAAIAGLFGLLGLRRRRGPAAKPSYFAPL